MHPRTEATLAQLKDAQWFRHVGADDLEMAEIVSSWGEAIENCASLEWQNLRLEAANQYRVRLLERSHDRFARWNETVDVVKPVTQALVREKTHAVVEAHQLPERFVATVDWDVLHLCMEAEYADVYPPGFYACLSYYYVSGHFPCGYKGAFPRGRFVVY